MPRLSAVVLHLPPIAAQNPLVGWAAMEVTLISQIQPSGREASGGLTWLGGSLSSAPSQGEVRAGGEAEPGAGQNLNQGVNRLMAAMRDMLANIQFQEPPRDDNPEGDGGDWD